MSQFSPGFGSRYLRFISQLLRSFWLFFPGILFLLLPIFCFWSLGQGKDIIIAFIDNDSAKSFLHLKYNRMVFFLAIGFWVYISWYSSRIVSYIKRKQQEKKVESLGDITNRNLDVTSEMNGRFYEIDNPMLDEFPRIIGNACFLILELAVLQLPVLSSAVTATQAWIIFIVALIFIRYINRWIDTTQSAKPSFRKIFWILNAAFIILIIIVSFAGTINILILFFLILLFHVVFICYTNLRRVQMEKKAIAVRKEVQQENKPTRLERTMDFFCIPRQEKGYYRWFLYTSIAGGVLYFINIISLSFARNLGPFSAIIFAFAVLLAFGNVITAFSVRSKVNFHLILFVLALCIGGLHETHYVRVIESKNNNGYGNRPILSTYLRAWLNDRNVLADTTSNGYEIYFVMANGGASRSAYWTASVLGRIEDSSVTHHPSDRFSDHVFCLSGTSGGGIGLATFFSLLRDKEQHGSPLYSASARAFLKQDYFTYTFARMLGPDFFNYIFPFSATMDRAAALEKSFETSARDKKDNVLEVPFYDNFSNFPALKNNKINLPLLCINTTRMQDGNPGVVTNLLLDSKIFNNRVDVLKLLGRDADISITSGSVLGARFPYLSPAGRIGDSYFVDGGYFDNSGAGVVQEMIRGILNIARYDSIHYGKASQLYRQISKLHFKVLHITNSPVILDSANIRTESPLKNDLLSPLLTILGAYDMQTTVNDVRLLNFINDINSFANNKADYTQIPLYEDVSEWGEDPLNKRFQTEPSYAMNWFMSDTTLARINTRLQYNPELNNLISSMK